MKIKAVKGSSDRIYPGIRRQIECLLNDKLSAHNITVSGLFKFMGQPDFFTFGLFKKHKNKPISKYGEWALINKSINETLDELEVDAYVRTARYVVRAYKEGGNKNL
jgi:hypothetical protein